jgi:hypothetical protein
MTHRHERLDRATFRAQVDCGRTIYRTRVLHDRPGRILVRFPPLLFLFPLWIVLARMARSGAAGKAVRLFPRLVAGRSPRIRGFLEARRQYGDRRVRAAGHAKAEAGARVSAGRLAQGLALARDWIAPGEALAQWTHFVTSICNAVRALLLPDQRR